MIISDDRENDLGSTSMAGYSIDDPWTSSASPTRLEATSSYSRPLTWAPGSSSERSSSSTARYQSSDPGEDSTAGFKLPELYEKVWNLCKSASQSDDVDISLGQLGKVVQCAQSLGAADVERVSQYIMHL